MLLYIRIWGYVVRTESHTFCPYDCNHIFCSGVLSIGVRSFISRGRVIRRGGGGEGGIKALKVSVHSYIFARKTHTINSQKENKTKISAMKE